MNKRSQTIKLAPFSQKYIDYFEKSKTAKINVLEGSIRSGKTILNLCAFANYIDNHPTGGLFLASCITSGAAWEIIAENRGHATADGKYGAPQGFGLLYLFRGRCLRTKVKNVDALVIKNKNKKKCTILFAGGHNKGCIDAIRGLTFSGWIATELENHSCVEGNDFIGFMIGRLLGAPHGKMFFDLNPSYPTNRMYTQYIDTFEKKLGSGYNYLKCNIFDNAGFTAEQVEDTLKLYTDKNSVMYQRDILGNRACAEGLIFGAFARNESPFVLHDMDLYLQNHKPNFITIGVDFGGSGSNTAFCATIWSDGFKHIMPFIDDEIEMSDESADVGVFRSRFRDFVTLVKLMKVAELRYIFCDSADPVMVREVRGVIRDMKMADSVRIIGADKGKIKDRIKAKKVLMAHGVWQVFHSAEYVINSTRTQVWDGREGHEDERLDNGSVDIDIADAEEYSWSYFKDKLLALAEK